MTKRKMRNTHIYMYYKTTYYKFQSKRVQKAEKRTQREYIDAWKYTQVHDDALKFNI